ncbi:hypothetical protein ACTGJ9_014650 [Bradyrhizobium sp. RDM12]
MVSLVLMMQSAQIQPLTVDPEFVVPLPPRFDTEPPASDVPPEIARFQGAWIGTWQDDRHILVVERVRPDGHADVVFARSDSAFNGMNREWWRDQATVVDGVLTMTGFRIFRYAFDGPDRLYMTATLKNGAVTSGALVRADPSALLQATGRTTGLGLARASGFRISGFARLMAHGRSRSKARSTRRRARGRHRSRSSLMDPTSVGISSGPGRSRPRRIGCATMDSRCWC